MRPSCATVARVSPVQKVACSNHVRVNFFYQFLRVDAFDIILIVISVYARKVRHKAWWRNGSALAPVQKVACSNHVRVNFFYQFLGVDAFDIISIVIYVHAMKR